MTRLQFDFEFVNKHAKINAFNLTDDLTVYRKPLQIWNEKTDETISFKTIDELLNYKIDGVTVWDMIEQRDTVIEQLRLD